VDREISRLYQGATNTAGTFDLDPGETSTVVLRRGVSSTSVIQWMAASALADQTTDIQWIDAAKDQFTVHHTNSADARTYRYVYATPPGS
jgi:ABC-type phosphonate transport system ATPase subunit